jgi:tetratricopeptide (TPR) repeat protein
MFEKFNMTWKEIVIDKNVAFHRVSSIIILEAVLAAAMITVVCPYVKDFTPDKYDNFISLSLLLLTQGILAVYWIIHRSVFPKGSKKKQSIVIAITTEDKKQKSRITKDFCNELNNRLIEFGLNKDFEVKELHNHLSKEARSRIVKRYENKTISDSGTEEYNSYESMRKRMRAKLIVYGDLISRNSPDDRYYLKIEAIINHNKVDTVTGKTFRTEFNDVWNNEINFLQKEEYTGFQSTGKQVFFASTYMIGLTTFAEVRFDKGIEIYEKLLQYIRSHSEFSKYEPKVTALLASTYFMHSVALQNKGEIDKSIEIRRKFHSFTPDKYDKCLNESIYQVKCRNNPDLALEYVDRAEKLTKGDGTWRYNKLYLLILKRDLKKALIVLDEILSNKFKNEISTVRQIISYNEVCLRENKEHIQTYFLVGAFLYKKGDKPLIAYEKLEKFVDLVEDSDEWKLFAERAKTYITEIDKIIGVK